jgi:hypothetical protein
MQLQRFIIIGSALIMLTGCEHSLIRDSMLPTVTRTGEVKDIVIKERLSLATVTANPGDYTAKIDTNDTAGVCFRDPAELTYVVRAESNDPSGEQNFAGSLRIGSEAQVHQPMEKNTNVAAKSDQDEPAMSR